MDFSSYPDPVFRDTFRFPKPLCIKIRNYLQVYHGFGENVRVRQGVAGRGRKFYTYKTEEILLIYLRRMALPDRLVDVAKEFGRCPEEISTASIFMAEQINAIAKEYMDGRPTAWWNENQARYNGGLSNQFDVPLQDVCLYIDGTLEGICNPWIAHVQARYYSGYIRKTANKIVVAVCPQGLFVWVSGWSEGRRHDMAVGNRHNMYPKLRGLTQYPNFQGLAYADSAFREENPVHTPYNPSDTARKRQFNKKMASVRITAEWAFQIVRSLWPSVKYVPRQKILQGRHGNLPGKNLYNSFFLTNLHSCYARTNLIGTYFDATLPTLEEYLGVPANSLD